MKLKYIIINKSYEKKRGSMFLTKDHSLSNNPVEALQFSNLSKAEKIKDLLSSKKKDNFIWKDLEIIYLIITKKEEKISYSEIKKLLDNKGLELKDIVIIHNY